MKEDRPYVLHIRDCIERITRYTAKGKDAFFADSRTQDAVLRNLEIIGEAVKRLSPQARLTEPDIPWTRIAGMRDKLIHDYFSVNLSLVWDVVEDELPRLRIAVGDLLGDGD